MGEDKDVEITSDGSVVQAQRYRPEMNTATVTKITEDGAQLGSVHSSRRTQFLAHNYQGETAIMSSAWVLTEDMTAEAEIDGKLMYLADPKPHLVVLPPPEFGAKDINTDNAKVQSSDSDDKYYEDKTENKRGSKIYYNDRK